MTKGKGKFGKFGPQKKRRNMDKVKCYGCQELGHYKRDCPKHKWEREEAHITEEVKELETKKLKKEEAKYIYYH